MSSLSIVTFLVLVCFSAASAQTTVNTYSDACHVYLIDVKVAEKAFDEFISSKSDAEAEMAMSKGVKIVGEFAATIGEEETTTKTYIFPGSTKKITASVFYTDEMMDAESMLLGIVISDKAQESAFSIENNALAEFTYNNQTGKVRVKKNVIVNGRPYLIGLECDCSAKRKIKKPDTP
jgi:hypothetical protein